MRIYFGRVGWGWKMYGIGYKHEWFLGFSRRVDYMTTDDLVSRLQAGEKITPEKESSQIG